VGTTSWVVRNTLAVCVCVCVCVHAVFDYCLNEWFNATCERLPGHVILMTSAKFGRMTSGRCIAGDFNVGCVKDVLHGKGQSRGQGHLCQ